MSVDAVREDAHSIKWVRLGGRFADQMIER